MKEKTKLPILSLFFVLLNIYIAHAQNGVFYYTDSSSLNYNTRIVDIKENTETNEIYLLGKVENEDFSKVEGFYFARVDESGKSIMTTISNESNLYDINNMILMPKTDFDKNAVVKIYGSTRSDGFFSSFNKIVDKEGKSATSMASMVTFSTLFKSVFDVGNGTSLAVLSALGNNRLFNLRVSLTGNADGYSLMYKKVVSTFNEEASQIIMLKDSSIIILAKRYASDFSYYTSVLWKLAQNGDSVWCKEIEESKNFIDHSICADKTGQIYYAYNNVTDAAVNSESTIFILDDKGEVKEKKTIANINVKGMLVLKNNNILLYGNKFKTETSIISTTIKRASLSIINSKLDLIKHDELSATDAPDKDIPGIAPPPCSTDILCAIQLKDGRIACAGRVFMPEDCSPTMSLFSTKTNRPLLILITDVGGFR